MKKRRLEYQIFMNSPSREGVCMWWTQVYITILLLRWICCWIWIPDSQVVVRAPPLVSWVIGRRLRGSLRMCTISLLLWCFWTTVALSASLFLLGERSTASTFFFPFSFFLYTVLGMFLLVCKISWMSVRLMVSLVSERGGMFESLCLCFFVCFFQIICTNFNLYVCNDCVNE